MIRLQGDIHGHYRQYLENVKGIEYSVQLGDFGFEYDILDNLDPAKHKVNSGNHDNYDKITNYPHYLGDFGQLFLNGIAIFFIRGAYSVDKQWRLPGVSWWEQEELTASQGYKCIELFKQVKPNIVVSHDLPFQCVQAGCVTNTWKLTPSRTSALLSACFFEYQPKLWIGGHHHTDWTKVINSTRFICLDELSWLDISAEDGKINFVDAKNKRILEWINGNS